MFFSKKSPHEPGCMAVHLVVAALMLLFVLASLLGVYASHMLSEGLTFGTSQGSLAIIAFVVGVKGFFCTLQSCFAKCEMCGTK